MSYYNTEEEDEFSAVFSQVMRLLFCLHPREKESRGRLLSHQAILLPVSLASSRVLLKMMMTYNDDTIVKKVESIFY